MVGGLLSNMPLTTSPSEVPYSATIRNAQLEATTFFAILDSDLISAIKKQDSSGNAHTARSRAVYGQKKAAFLPFPK